MIIVIKILTIFILVKIYWTFINFWISRVSIIEYVLIECSKYISMLIYLILKTIFKTISILFKQLDRRTCFPSCILHMRTAKLIAVSSYGKYITDAHRRRKWSNYNLLLHIRDHMKFYVNNDADKIHQNKTATIICETDCCI